MAPGTKHHIVGLWWLIFIVKLTATKTQTVGSPRAPNQVPWSRKTHPKAEPHLVAIQMKGCGRRKFGYLFAHPRSLWHLISLLLWLALQPAFSGFWCSLKTCSSPGITQDSQVRLWMLRHPALWTWTTTVSLAFPSLVKPLLDYPHHSLEDSLINIYFHSIGSVLLVAPS